MIKDEKVQLSTRLSRQDYENFNQLCHLELRQMADVMRELMLTWIDKNKKKLK